MTVGDVLVLHCMVDSYKFFCQIHAPATAFATTLQADVEIVNSCHLFVLLFFICCSGDGFLSRNYPI